RRHVLDVCDLATLVLKEQFGTSRVSDNLSLVRQAVGNATVFNGLHQVRRGSLPLRTAGTSIRTGHLPLWNSHDYFSSLLSDVLSFVASSATMSDSCASAAQRGSRIS